MTLVHLKQGWAILPENYIMIFLGYISTHNTHYILIFFKSPQKHFTNDMTGRQNKTGNF